MVVEGEFRFEELGEARASGEVRRLGKGPGRERGRGSSKRAAENQGLCHKVIQRDLQWQGAVEPTHIMSYGVFISAPAWVSPVFEPIGPGIVSRGAE